MLESKASEGNMQMGEGYVFPTMPGRLLLTWPLWKAAPGHSPSPPRTITIQQIDFAEP